MFEDGQTNVHDEERSGRSAICSEWCFFSKCWPKNLWKTALHNFQNFRESFRKFHTLFSRSLLKFGYAITSFAQEGFRKYSWLCTKRREWLQLWRFRVIPQTWRWISQSHHTNKRWWNLAFICECWKQRAIKAVDAHTLTKQAEKV
jgi:hypothetical protein